jgi:hypothetical protein
MKTMKAFCTAIVLSLTISISAFAGDIATPGAAQTGDTGDTSTATFSTSFSVQPTDTQIGDLYVSTISDVLLTLVSMF